MWKLISGLIIVFSMTGSAVAAEKTVTAYLQDAAAASQRGDWNTARSIYSRLFTDERLAQSDLRFKAVLHYEYGRALGVTCFFKEAEREFIAGNELDKNDGDKQTGGVFYLSLTQLGRLNLAQRKFPEAVSYFEQILGELDPVISANTVPSFYSNLLDDYASALSGAGRSEEADVAGKRAAEIRASVRTAPRAIVDPTPYGTQCVKKAD